MCRVATGIGFARVSRGQTANQCCCFLTINCACAADFCALQVTSPQSGRRIIKWFLAPIVRACWQPELPGGVVSRKLFHSEATRLLRLMNEAQDGELFTGTTYTVCRVAMSISKLERTPTCFGNTLQTISGLPLDPFAVHEEAL